MTGIPDGLTALAGVAIAVVAATGGPAHSDATADPWPPPACRAQSLYAAPATQDSLPVVQPEWRDLVQTLVTRGAGADGTAAKAGGGLLAELWARDSGALTAALVEATVDPMLYGHMLAATASAYYLERIGEATPVLLALHASPDGSRRALGLSMIRGLTAPWQRSLVLRMACDAAWELTPFLSDPQYGALWLQRGPLSWPAEALLVLKEAERLSSGNEQVVIRQIRSRLRSTPLQSERGDW